MTPNDGTMHGDEAALRSHPMRVVETTEGCLWSIYNPRDPHTSSPDDFNIRQVYLTTIQPGKSKGPILHKQRRSLVVPLSGCLLIQLAPGGDELVVPAGASAVEIPPGRPVMYVNPSPSSDVIMLVLADYPWSPGSNESDKYNGWDDYQRKAER